MLALPPDRTAYIRSQLPIRTKSALYAFESDYYELFHDRLKFGATKAAFVPSDPLIPVLKTRVPPWERWIYRRLRRIVPDLVAECMWISRDMVLQEQLRPLEGVYHQDLADLFLELGVRDLHYANWGLDAHGKCKLLDFGEFTSEKIMENVGKSPRWLLQNDEGISSFIPNPPVSLYWFHWRDSEHSRGGRA